VRDVTNYGKLLLIGEPSGGKNMTQQRCKKVEKGEYQRRIDAARVVYHEAALAAAVAVFPVGEIFVFPYAEGPDFSETKYVVSGYKQAYDRTVSILVKRLDKTGRPNGKAVEMDPNRLDFCRREGQ
jgi:hypothetical protein